MSFRDSEFVTGLLLDKGFALAKSVDNADIILFNSCSVRKHAEERLNTLINLQCGISLKKNQLLTSTIDRKDF